MEELNQLAARVWQRVASGEAYGPPAIDAAPPRSCAAPAGPSGRSCVPPHTPSLLPLLLLLLVGKKFCNFQEEVRRRPGFKL